MKHAPSDITKERLYDEFNAVVGETEQLLKSVAAAGSDKAGMMRASVEKSLAAASERISKIREEAMGQASAAARATDEYVQESGGRPHRPRRRLANRTPLIPR
jgi:ElaB/YqjD/DUF883 family membrane-anchored ribosome-binding protein